MTDLEYIKNFNQITISSICKELKIDKSNLYAGRLSDDKVKEVKNELEKKIEELQKKS